jgi:hypothetical protein
MTAPVVLDHFGDVSFDRRGCAGVLMRLTQLKGAAARVFYVRLMRNWGANPDRERLTLRVNDDELELLRSLKLPSQLAMLDVVQCRYTVVYQYPKKRSIQVTVQTDKRPTKTRTFIVGGITRRLVAVSITKNAAIKTTAAQRKTTKENQMARAKKAAPVVEDDELDELDELEDLDDLEDEDLDGEEPEDEEDAEEDEPAPKKRRPAKATKVPVKKNARRKAAPVVEEDDEDEVDEDEGEEEEAPAPKRGRGRPKGSTNKTPAPKAPAKKPVAKKGGQPSQLTRELPAGKSGANEIAELAGVESREIRGFLRKGDNAAKWPKNEELGRYAFTAKQAQTIANAYTKWKASVSK